MSDQIHRSRRNLPHWYREGFSAIYSITFRLADSLPLEKLTFLEKERERFINDHPKPWDDEIWKSYHLRFTEQIETWLDAGYGSCFLSRLEIRQHLIDALLKFEGERHDLIAGVIMPNHVHLLLHPREGTEVNKLLQGIKGTSARWINKALGLTGSNLWMDESYDHIVRSKEELKYLTNYIRENPRSLSADSFWLEEREVSLNLRSDPSYEMLFVFTKA
ncbi:MAG: transposase [Luteolibacter sp.]